MKYTIEQLHEIVLVAQMGVVDNPSPLIIDLAKDLIEAQEQLERYEADGEGQRFS